MTIHAALFLGIGEATIRFDRETAFFRGDERLSNEAKTSQLKQLVDSGSFQPQANQLRILVVGDSYLFGAGVPPEQILSRRLATDLRNLGFSRDREVVILDITRPGSNTFVNKQDYTQYSPRFRPNIVLWAYNANDVYGDQNQPAKKTEARSHKTSGDVRLDLVTSMRRLVYRSKLVEFLAQSLNMELKLAGWVVPGSEFEHQARRSHLPSFPGWIQSQAHLRDVVDAAKTRQERLIVLNVPELNVLSAYRSLDQTHHSIARFFHETGAEYVELADVFLRRPEEKYALSRYDGHPNAAAHEVISKVVAAEILSPLSGSLLH